MDVQVRLGQQFFELAVFGFNFTQPPRIGYVHVAVLGAPFVEGRVAETAFRHSSFIGTPASACLMNPMICSSVGLLFLMSVILQVDGLRCHYAGTAEMGQLRRKLLDGLACRHFFFIELLHIVQQLEEVVQRMGDVADGKIRKRLCVICVNLGLGVDHPDVAP